MRSIISTAQARNFLTLWSAKAAYYSPICQAHLAFHLMNGVYAIRSGGLWSFCRGYIQETTSRIYMAKKKIASFNHSPYSFSLLGKLWQRCAIFGLTLLCTNVDLVRAPYFSSTYNNVFSYIIVRWVVEFPSRGYKINVVLPKKWMGLVGNFITYLTKIC